MFFHKFLSFSIIYFPSYVFMNPVYLSACLFILTFYRLCVCILTGVSIIQFIWYLNMLLGVAMAMFDMKNKMCIIFGSFTGPLKRIPLHYGVWEKNLLPFILLILQYFKHIVINIHYWWIILPDPYYRIWYAKNLSFNCRVTQMKLVRGVNEQQLNYWCLPTKIAGSTFSVKACVLKFRFFKIFTLYV